MTSLFDYYSLASVMTTWQEYKEAGNNAYKASNMKLAVEQYSLALATEDIPENDRSTVLCNRAQAYLKQGKNELAAEDATSSLTLTPNNVKALFRRAAALEAMKDFKSAKADYTTVLQISPAVPDAQAGLERCATALGETIVRPKNPIPSTAPKAVSKPSSAPFKISEEDQNSFLEAQARVKEVARQMARAREQLRLSAAEKRRMELTLNQIEPLPEDQVLYRGLGKMFVRAPKDDIITDLKTNSERAEQKSKTATSSLEYLSSQEKEADAQLLEIMASIKRKNGRA